MPRLLASVLCNNRLVIASSARLSRWVSWIRSRRLSSRLVGFSQAGVLGPLHSSKQPHDNTLLMNLSVPHGVQMSRTQKNKATEYHLGQLKAKLAKLRTQLQEPPKVCAAR